MIARNQPLYAVLIDADNIPAKHAEVILKEITTFGEPALRRVYGDWSSENLRGWAETVREHGLLAHQETANTKGKKASMATATMLRNSGTNELIGSPFTSGISLPSA